MFAIVTQAEKDHGKGSGEEIWQETYKEAKQIQQTGRIYIDKISIFLLAVSFKYLIYKSCL